MLALTPLPDMTAVHALTNKALGLRSAVDRQIEENDRRVRELMNEDELLGLVGTLIKKLIDAEVTDGVKAVERLQTEGLAEIFHDQSMSVRADVDESRGRVTVTLLTQRTLENGTVVEGEADQSFGGSILTMQSILMRITVIFRRNLRPLLLLDETLSAVANKYVDRAAKFLSSLCKNLGIDILLISHDEALVGAADLSYQVSYVKDRAKFRETTPGAE
jgi:hypothetical protein